MTIRIGHGFDVHRLVIGRKCIIGGVDIPFEKGLKDTVAWYLENQSWWADIKTGDYAAYYERMYATR